MTFLSSKNPPFEKTTSSNDKALKIFFIFDQNHLEKFQLESWNDIFIILPLDEQGEGGRPHAHKVFLSFLLKDTTSAPDDSW